MPDDTDRLFAWTIHPTMTSMVLASAYLGGCWFFVRVLREPSWAAVRTGLLSVTPFASLLAVATALHWDRFAHSHPAFWLWAGLCFTAPFLIAGAWWANSRAATVPGPQGRRLAPGVRALAALVGLLALAQGLTLFLAPGVMSSYWPWALTPLTSRVMGAVLCLGSAHLGVLAGCSSRWWTMEAGRSRN